MAPRNAAKALKIGWIGAGSINFGSLEGPWNHAARLQKQKGVQFTAIVEPNLDLARVRAVGLQHDLHRQRRQARHCRYIDVAAVHVLQRRVEEYQAGPFPEKWKDCKVFRDHQSMIESDAKPKAAVVGIPHALRGKQLCTIHKPGKPQGLGTYNAFCSGSMDIAGKTMEIDLAKAGLHMMIEKPISMRPVEEVERLAQVALAKHTCQMLMKHASTFSSQ